MINFLKKALIEFFAITLGKISAVVLLGATFYMVASDSKTKTGVIICVCIYGAFAIWILYGLLAMVEKKSDDQDSTENK